MKAPIDVCVRRLVRRFGFDVERRRPVVPDLLHRLGIDTVLDVGANVGQYATRLRAWGHHGRIVSFEPVQPVFRVLQRAVARDSLWDARNVALDDADRDGTNHVAEASVFSSILNARPELRARHFSAAAIGEQNIKIRRLDSTFEDVGGDGQRFYLKVDTQGYEREVIRGAAKGCAPSVACRSRCPCGRRTRARPGDARGIGPHAGRVGLRARVDRAGQSRFGQQLAASGRLHFREAGHRLRGCGRIHCLNLHLVPTP